MLIFSLIFMSQSLSVSASETKLPRIVSLNMCADPYLMAFADPTQILAITHLSRDPSLSAFHEIAQHLPITDGRIESILRLAPDIVITSPYSDPLRQDILKAHNISVIPLFASQRYEQARREIIKLGTAIGRDTAAKKYLAQLDAALDAAKAKHQNHKYNVRLLYLQRRGITAGAGHILDDIITKAGAKNAAYDKTRKSLSHIRLEHIFTLKPDFLLLGTDKTGGRGNDILIHPSLAKIYPAARRLYLPEKFTICAGASTPLAVEALQNELEQKYTHTYPRYK
ncbi:MAG: ABC transporter substrate-binding protein [Alphaproteobacteria bacterium]|nr:ABC transporter substrate-binding protein [Alphaproteobacteria bacterium]